MAQFASTIFLKRTLSHQCSHGMHALRSCHLKQSTRLIGAPTKHCNNQLLFGVKSCNTEYTPRRHYFHRSSTMAKSIDGTHVTIEQTVGSTKNNITGDDASDNNSNGNKATSTCSQGVPIDNEDDDEEDQEEMFVVADPVLGHGTIQEWGGPRRGGTLAEPTRFGDWERKGRCTDF